MEKVKSFGLLVDLLCLVISVPLVWTLSCFVYVADDVPFLPFSDHAAFVYYLSL